MVTEMSLPHKKHFRDSPHGQLELNIHFKHLFLLQWWSWVFMIPYNPNTKITHVVYMEERCPTVAAESQDGHENLFHLQ